MCGLARVSIGGARPRIPLTHAGSTYPVDVKAVEAFLSDHKEPAHIAGSTSGNGESHSHKLLDNKSPINMSAGISWNQTAGLSITSSM